MSISIRLARMEDLPGMQACNLQNLPENYTMKFYMYHLSTFPSISYVAEDHKGRIIGYILGTIEIEDIEGWFMTSGHVLSISVIRSHRRLGLAQKLMIQSQEAMKSVHKALFVSLHVRKSNRAAVKLYKDSLGFSVHKFEKGYYADGEDAYSMRLTF